MSCRGVIQNEYTRSQTRNKLFRVAGGVQTGISDFEFIRVESPIFQAHAIAKLRNRLIELFRKDFAILDLPICRFGNFVCSTKLKTVRFTFLRTLNLFEVAKSAIRQVKDLVQVLPE